MADPNTDIPYWSRDVAGLSAELGSGPGGLSAAKAAEQFRRVGSNSVEDASETSSLRLLLKQFESPLVLILIFAALISLALKEWVDANIILAIVVGSSLLGFYQEYQASAAVEELKRRLALTCRVVRDGTEQTVGAATIVPGDVIALSAGNLIPADGLLIEAADFLVNQASLTGESFPVEKQPGIVPPETPIVGRTNAVYLGASVQSGKAKMLVVETGHRTAFGAIAAKLKTAPPETDFERGIRDFGYLLIRVMIVIIVFVLAVNLLLGRPLIDSLLFAVALAVGLSPELLPAIISVTLSAGARAMAEQGVIVRRLDAIENLGSMDILCTDKTGTLTEGVIVLQGATDAGGKTSTQVRQLAFLNAAFESGIENPLDGALVTVGKSAGLTTQGYRKVDEIPYDFRRKRLTTVMSADSDASQHLLVTKGAFDNVLAICSSVDRDGSNVPLTTDQHEQLEAFYQAKGQAGFRVLAVATRKVAAKDRYSFDDEEGMAFAGFLIFFDPPKADAQQTIRDLSDLGIRIKIISGDNRHVTAHLAEAVGLDPKAIIAGDELANLSDDALSQRAPRTDLFVEVDPQQKERIVRALQRTGHAVGYMGDGINDAPSLHAADVGISVDQAVDVARESADIILLKPDLDVLRHGVANGRRTFANTLKYINITTSASFGNMVSMALGTPLLPFLPMSATQILLENFLSDLPSIAISTDNIDPETVKNPVRWNINDVRRFMIVFGLISSIFDLLTFAILLLGFHSNEAVFQTTWFVISLLTELAVVLVLRTRGSALRSRPSNMLLWSTIAVSVVAVAIPYLGPVASAFGFVPLSTLQMGIVFIIVVGYVVATEGAKAWFYYPTRNASQPNTVAAQSTGANGPSLNQAFTRNRRNVMSSVDSSPPEMQLAVRDALRAHWRLFLFQAVVTIILGILAVGVLTLVAPSLATRNVGIYIGWLFLISGIVGLVAVVSANDMTAFLWSLITSALSVAVGILFGVFLLIWPPIEEALSLTIVLAAFFIAEGTFQIAASLAYRDVPAGGWMLASGIVNLGLAAAIISISGWPTASPAGWALGLIVGVNLITSGWAILMTAFSGRDVAGSGPAPTVQTH